jgi:hypothetical protein
MPTYRVVYAIDVETDSVELAARQVWSYLTDPQSFPPVLEVIAWNGDQPPVKSATGVVIDCQALQSGHRQ